MGIVKRLRAFFTRSPTATQLKMVTEQGNGFFTFDKAIYKSDVVRGLIRPNVRAIGKAKLQHIRIGTNQKGEKVTLTNPDPYIRAILEYPNQLMGMQQLLEKMAVQLRLNSNAFALVMRDESGIPVSIFPLIADLVEAKYATDGRLFLTFHMKGKQFTFNYNDIIHLRVDYNDNDIFGTPPWDALLPLMEIVQTTDQSIVQAVKNSAVIRWLLKFTTSLRQEDIDKQVKAFADAFLNASHGTGVAGVDTKAEAVQVSPNDYVPNASLQGRTMDRYYSFFNTNEKIVKSNFTEDEWISYYESQVEPDLLQIAAQFTKALFNPRQRAYGNRIFADANNLMYASMQTKLALQAMVDRGAMSPNEWREVLNMAPAPGGDQMIRRLDTQPTEQNARKEDT